MARIVKEVATKGIHSYLTVLNVDMGWFLFQPHFMKPISMELKANCCLNFLKTKQNLKTYQKKNKNQKKLLSPLDDNDFNLCFSALFYIHVHLKEYHYKEEYEMNYHGF